MRSEWALVGILLALPVGAQEAPLSAIDWMKPAAVALPPSGPVRRAAETPISKTAIAPEVTVTTLDAPRVDATGLLPASVTGLPVTLWQASSAEAITTLIGARSVDRLPAMQALFYTLLLAEAEPPHDAGPQAPVLQARIDALMRLGAVEPAQALLERAGAGTAALFRRWFDATLLTGDEDSACAALAARPHLAPDYAARVYCTARRGDWATAALTLDTARALGFISDIEDRLLAQFLDPEMFEGEPLPLPPVRPTPLLFRLYEAAGEPLPTATLPRAFAMSDLRPTAGWKAELSAAERLTQTGALSVNRLLGIYTDRLPAASGGIWDRVEAVQRFDTAITAGDPGAVATTLPRAWSSMQAARLEVPFAELYGAALMRLPLTGDAARMAYDIALLGPGYEEAATLRAAQHPARAFESGLARGAPVATDADPLRLAIAMGFSGAEPPADIATMLAEGRLGEAILSAMALYEQAARGDIKALTPALATLRAVGLEDSARRAALQLVLLRLGG